MSLEEILKNKFDKIYVLSMVDRKDRHELISNQFEIFSLPKPDETNFIRYYYGTSFPFNTLIANAFNTSGKGKFTKANEYDCARNHYAMIKICYELGCEHCLIMEDDILFINSPEHIINVIENIPDDYDIIQFGGFTTDPRILGYCHNLDKNIGNTYWTKHKNVGVWNASMYALSRKGMKFFLTFMESKLFWVADGPLYMAPRSEKLVNTYITRIPMVIQADKNVISSDIRNKDNDNIDYNNQNVYESEIDINYYYNSDK